MKKKRLSLRMLTVTAILSAVASVLMILEFSVPFVPSFLKFDFSDLPAYLAAFSLGPFSGMLVELIKNLIHLPLTQTGGIGELANFLVGTAMVLPAGCWYRHQKTKKGAVCGVIAGTVFAGAVSFPVNFFITYPFYAKLMPMEGILALYRAIFPFVDTLPEALLTVNVPFTVLKGLVNALITFVLYKKLSPILKGTRSDTSVR